MAAVYSIRMLELAGASGIHTAGPPAGTVWVLRSIVIYIPPGISGPFVFVAGPLGNTLAYLSPAPASTGFQIFDMRQVIEAGEVFAAEISDGTADVTVSGYQLTLP